MKSLSILSFALLCSGTALHAQHSQFNPSLSLLVNYPAIISNMDIQQGNFSTSSKIMPGIAFINRFHLSKNLFLDAGLRITTYSFNIRTQGTEMVARQWRNTYSSITIPVLLGKKFTTHKGHKGSYFAGVAAGVLLNVFQDGETITLNQDNLMTYYMYGPFNATKAVQAFATIDAGISYQPFRKLPRLEAGLLVSAQVTKSASTNYATFIIENGLTEHDYDMNMRPVFISGNVVLTYRFVKKLRKVGLPYK